MADVAIDSSVIADLELRFGDGRWIVTKDKDTIYSFYVDVTSADLKYNKSTDGGTNWGGAVDLEVGTVLLFCIWYDKWTTGDTGTRVHVFWLEDGADDIRYKYLDTADDSIAGEVQVVDTGTASTVNLENSMTCTKAVGDNLYVGYSIEGGGSGNKGGFYRSTDAGATWEVRANPYPSTNNLEQVMLLWPGNETDEDDVWAIYWAKAGNMAFRVYDNSGDVWDSTTLFASAPANEHDVANEQISGAIRHSDGHLIVAIWNAFDVATADLTVWDINGAASITQKTNVLTDLDDIACCALMIDQNTDDIYVGYLGDDDSGDAYLATVQVFYKISTDGAGTWGSEVAYSEDAADDFRALSCPMSVTTSGLWCLGWYDDDDNDLFFGVTNSIEITAPAGGGTVPLRTLMGVGT